MSAHTQTLTASLASAGSFSEQTRRQLSGQVTLSGGLRRSVLVIVLSAVLAFIGGVNKVTHALRRGTLSFVGRTTKLTRLFPTGHVRSLGALIRQSVWKLTGHLTFAGHIKRSVVAKLVSAGLTFVGGIQHRYGKALTVSHLTSSGHISRRITYPLAGALHAAGAIKRSTTYRLATAHLTPIGRTTKLVKQRLLSAALSFTGAFADHRGLYNVKPTGTLSFSVRFEALSGVDTLYQPNPDTYLGLYSDEILMVMPDLQFQLVEAPSRDQVLQPNDPWRTK